MGSGVGDEGRRRGSWAGGSGDQEEEERRVAVLLEHVGTSSFRKSETT